MRRQAFSKRARCLDRLSRPSWASWVDGLADRQLVGRDDALGLVTDIDEDFVVVNADNVTGDDIALGKGVQSGVVVGNDPAVDLQQQTVRPFDDLRDRFLGGWGQSG